MSRLLIIRHSERIDEINLKHWLQLVEQENGTRRREKDDHANDPILTDNGHRIATTAAAALKRRLTDGFFSVSQPQPVAIYCSRLRRCIETAYRISLELQLPIVVSRGLALTAKAVDERRGGSDQFGFLNLDEIRSFCPGVDVLSADADDYSGALCTLSFPLSAPFELDIVPATCWHEALASIARRQPFSIVVAHRESIRNIAGKMHAPYCSMAMFDFAEDKFSFQYLLDHQGDRIK